MLLPRSHIRTPLQRVATGWFCLNCRRTLTSRANLIQEGDRAFLQYKDQHPVFTKPLRPSDKTTSQYGDIAHDSLIGRQARDLVTTSEGREVRVYLPTLEDYVKLTPRIVTPIYPADANLMVSLLDIHAFPEEPSMEGQQGLEILEAGTGHGALTLYLARAIHASNANVLNQSTVPDGASEKTSLSSAPNLNPLATGVDANSTVIQATSADGGPASRTQSESSNGRYQRRAVIHTLEISRKHSDHARMIVQGFRRGLYSNDVKFYVGDVSEWIDQQTIIREQNHTGSKEKAFLSHIILDLPSSYHHIEKAASVLHVNGNLLVFNPNITQITKCVQRIKEQKLPLVLERIVELGVTMTGGRQWDIRAFKPRVLLNLESEKKLTVIGGDDPANMDSNVVEQTSEKTLDHGEKNEKETQAQTEDDVGWVMICRPKPFIQAVGGGFLGVWKRMRHRGE